MPAWLYAYSPATSSIVAQSARNGATVAQKVQTLFIDDIDGSAAEGTVRFGLGGTEYEIDLSAEHAQQLRDALATYMRAGRRVTGASRRAAPGGNRAPASRLNTAEIREWPRPRASM